MDIKEYSKLIKAKRKELDGLMKRKMPVIAGRMAKDHFQDNFRREGFVNGGLHPWPASVVKARDVSFTWTREELLYPQNVRSVMAADG